MAAEYSPIGIDPNRIYFREDIAKLWGYDFDPEQHASLPAAQRRELAVDDMGRLRKWFRRNFISKGLRSFRTANRIAVHGRVLAEWVLYNSGHDDE